MSHCGEDHFKRWTLPLVSFGSRARVISFRFRRVGFINPKGPRTQMIGFRAQILEYCSIWALEPHYFGPWTLRVRVLELGFWIGLGRGIHVVGFRKAHMGQSWRRLEIASGGDLGDLKKFKKTSNGSSGFRV